MVLAPHPLHSGLTSEELPEQVLPRPRKVPRWDMQGLERDCRGVLRVYWDRV